MKQIIIVTSESLDFAFRQVRELNISENSSELRSIPQIAVLEGKIAYVWDSIEATIRKGYIYGQDLIQDTIDILISSVNDLLHEAGKQAKEVHNILLKKLQTFLKNLIDGALKLIPSSVTVGENEFSINKISYGQKLMLGGSLKANLLEAIELTSNGEMELSVEYAKG